MIRAANAGDYAAPKLRVETSGPPAPEAAATPEAPDPDVPAHLDVVWDRDLPDSPRSVDALRRLGVEPTTGASTIRTLLRPERFVPLEAANFEDHAKVMWLDPDLARLFGFPVSRGQRLSRTLERSLLSALAYRLPEPDEDVSGRRTLTMFADRYGGAGLGDNEGAGRAAFFPCLNLYAKGIGKTPLHHPSRGPEDDRVHEHGMLPVREAAIEAIWGQVGENLFTHGAARTLAIIELGGFVRWGVDDDERACILLRTGLHARPAHIIDPHDASVAGGRSFFLSTARGLGLVSETRDVDLRIAIRKLIDAHAEVAAEQYRFRVLHGAISTSNMLLSGEQLDVATMSAQLRTAPIRVLDDGAFFGREHMERMRELRTVYRALLGRLEYGARGRLKAVDFPGEMSRQYQRHLDLQFLKATGFKAGLAARIAGSDPGLARRYGDLLLSMCRLSFEAEGTPRSVVDVFGLLTEAAARGRSERAQLEPDLVIGLLQPELDGAEEGERERLERRLTSDAAQFAELHPLVVAAAERWADAFYDDLPSMRRAVAARAAFENRPLDRLTRENLAHSVDQAVQQYDPFSETARDQFWRQVDDLVAGSLRSVDGLLRQGRARRIDDDTLELESRDIGGIGYAIRASVNGGRALRVTLPIEGHETSGYRVPGLDLGAPLSMGEVSSFVYQYTTRDWHEVEAEGAPLRCPARLESDLRGLPCLVFTAPVEAGTAAHLEGVFELSARPGTWLKDGPSNFRGYTFAVPDGRDLTEMLSTAALKNRA